MPNAAFQNSTAPLDATRNRWNVVRWLAVLIILAVLGAFIAIHAGRWKDRFVPRRFRTVGAGKIYASGQIDRHLLPGILAEHHIREIISLLPDDISDPDVAAEIRLSKDQGIERHTYRLSGDGTGDIREYARAVAQMVEAESAGKPLLIHCSSGAQRSNAATFFFRVFIEHWDADDAAREMVRNGHDPRRNPALIPYLNAQMRPMAELLAAQGVIPAIPDPLPRITRVP